MGEPLIASLICGAVALSMVVWNWRLMEAQRRRGRRVAQEACAVAKKRAKPTMGQSASASPPAKVRRVASSRHVQLEPCAWCSVSVHGGGKEGWNERWSPRFFENCRNRLETGPLSPPATWSPGYHQHIGFFQEPRCATPKGSPHAWRNTTRERAPTGASDLDTLLEVNAAV